MNEIENKGKYHQKRKEKEREIERKRKEETRSAKVRRLMIKVNEERKKNTEKNMSK